jgi:hypothetical protein
MSRPDHNNRIAIVGGGPAGLVAATSLLEEGLQPVLFEQSSLSAGSSTVQRYCCNLFTVFRLPGDIRGLCDEPGSNCLDCQGGLVCYTLGTSWTCQGL